MAALPLDDIKIAHSNNRFVVDTTGLLRTVEPAVLLGKPPKKARLP
jgi:hypothetical protein